MTAFSSSQLNRDGLILRNGLDVDYIVQRGSHTVIPTVVTSGSSYTVQPTDYIVLIKKDTGSATAVTLPAPTSVNTDAGQAVSQIIRIVDAKGDSGTNNITITAASGNINGSATKVLNANYASISLITDGTNWFSI